MFQAKTYIKLLFFFFFLLAMISVGYVYDFSKKYPLPITNRISLDAKLMFIKNKINPDEIDTLIVGSSIGLNNVLGSVLEEASSKVKHAINLSVYEATTLEVEQLLKLADAFPNLKRIIYSTQYSDFPHAKKYQDFHPKLYRKYMRNELSLSKAFKVYFNACNNLLFCYERAKSWEEKHMKDDQFTYLGFDHTGSVPLEIYRKEKVKGGRWSAPHPGIMHGESFAAVHRMSKQAAQKGIKFYLAHQHYREPLVKKYPKVEGALNYFDRKIEKIFQETHGVLIALQRVHLSDDYHADRSHLNRKGATIISKEIAKVIERTESKE